MLLERGCPEAWTRGQRERAEIQFGIPIGGGDLIEDRLRATGS